MDPVVGDRRHETRRQESEARENLTTRVSCLVSHVFRHPSGLTNSKLFVTIADDRGVAQLVAHSVWDAGVAGSNPVSPTNDFRFVILDCSQDGNLKSQI